MYRVRIEGMKTLCIIIILITNILGDSMPRYEQINDYFHKSTSVITHVDGISREHESDSQEYKNILSMLDTLCENSRDLPALGVSLHNETKEALGNGVWLELIYSDTLYHNEMPFDSLLINVQPNYMGFDLIRGMRGKYEGRCFHLSINGYITPLYDLIVSMQ